MSSGAPPSDRARPGWLRWGPWLALLVVVVVALVLGSRPSDDKTMQDKVHTIAGTLKCPQCTGESMATSNAPTAVAGRKEIERQLREGRSADEIRAWFTRSYGDHLLLTPQRSGFDALVWVLPVFAFVIAAAALGAVFLRWRRAAPEGPSDEDRAAVEAARRDRTP